VTEGIAAAAVALLVGAFSRRALARLFLWAVLIGEFHYIVIGDGFARVYHFMAPVVVMFCASHLRVLARSSVFVAAMMFCGTVVASVCVSHAPDAAAASAASFAANMGVAQAVALVLAGGYVSIPSFKGVIRHATFLSVAWGVTQIAANTLGVNLGLSESQIEQISAGWGPGFRTEANTFAKFLLLPLMLALPDYVEGRRVRDSVIAYAVMAVGFVLNFTRTAVYGLSVAFVYVGAWYTGRGKAVAAGRRTAQFALLAGAMVALVLGGVIPGSEYGVHKIGNLFNRDEVALDTSGGYRLEQMRAIVEMGMSSAKTIALGRGWGQTYIEIGNKTVQAGGGDVVTVFGYGGLIGAAAYVLLIGSAFLAARRATRSGDLAIARLAKGAMFAWVAMSVTGQLSGYLITPDLWLLLGTCEFLSCSRVARQELPVPSARTSPRCAPGAPSF
jgi:hypothetical protein